MDYSYLATKEWGSVLEPYFLDCKKKSILRFTWRELNLVSAHSHNGEAAIESANTIDERRSKIVRNRVLECHLSPIGRQMAIKNTASSDF